MPTSIVLTGSVGWAFLGSLAPGDRDNMMPTPAEGGRSVVYRPLSHYDATSCSHFVLSSLTQPLHPTLPLLDPRLARSYWREHSGRAFIPSAAACLGYEGQELDLLGGWRPHGGAAYVRLVRCRVGRVHEQIRNAIDCGKSKFVLEEDESLQDLAGLFRERGATAAEVTAQVFALSYTHAPSLPPALCDDDEARLHWTGKFSLCVTWLWKTRVLCWVLTLMRFSRLASRIMPSSGASASLTCVPRGPSSS